MSFVMIDLDHFKAVNDTYGHTMGDSVLAATGGYLAGQLRSSDISCRFGGEEFCIVMPNTSRAGAVLRMQTLLAGYRQLIFSAKDVQLSELTFSVGVAELKDTELMTSLLDRADQALYRAKAAGRDRVESA
jgi:diguanylate cyclase (GGDEF)-like protein